MASRSIGTLTAFITANADAFMKEFSKLDRQIARASASFTKPGAKLALGFLGVESALKAVSNEVRRVVENVENIPGVPAEALSNIITFRNSITEARIELDKMIAKAISFAVQAGQAVGTGAAMIVNKMQGIDTDTSALAKLPTPDEVAMGLDPNFNQKIDAARTRLSEARKAAALAAADDATQIKMLMEEAERYEKFSQSSSLNTVQRLDAEREAFERTTQANSKLAAMRQKLTDIDKKNAQTQKDVIVASTMMTGEEKLTALRAEANDLRKQIFEAGTDDNDPESLQKRIELRQRLDEVMRKQIPLYEKEKALAMDVGNTFASAFGDAILGARSLGEALRALAQDLMRLVLQQLVLNKLASGIAGAVQGLFTPSGISFDKAPILSEPLPGRATGGDVAARSMYMVGERGPELFVPKSNGVIVPNHRLGGGGVVVNLTNHFASGVTRQEVAALFPRMVEAAKNAVADGVGRGGGYRRAFA